MQDGKLQTDGAILEDSSMVRPFPVPANLITGGNYIVHKNARTSQARKVTTVGMYCVDGCVLYVCMWVAPAAESFESAFITRNTRCIN